MYIHIYIYHLTHLRTLLRVNKPNGGVEQRSKGGTILSTVSAERLLLKEDGRNTQLSPKLYR